MKLVFATQNPGKVTEMAAILKELPIDVISAREAGITDDIEEDGVTLEENALKKARRVAQRTHEWSLADDTGFFIDALQGDPGIHAKRWAGNTDDLAGYTLEKMKGIPENKRGASFMSVVAIVAPDGKEWTFRGDLKGYITTVPRGNSRITLPYDTIFIPGNEQRTFAEMSDAEKNALSHRGRAFASVKQFLSAL